MFNPLCLFTPELLDAFVKADKRYFVRQSYYRGSSTLEEGIKGNYLITHYSKLNDAREHLEALKTDPFRFLYDWETEEDRNKLIIAAQQPEGYKVYASVVMPDWKTRAEKILKDKIRLFVNHKLKWHPSRKDTLDFQLYPHYGEVFVTIKLKNQVIETSLADIENFR
jgi:hypothetical protein